MYNGPFYYHQPGHGQHNRAYELLGRGIVDRFIFAPSGFKGYEHKIPEEIARFHAAGKHIMFDVERYNPDNITAHNGSVGTEVLLNPEVHIPYVRDALDRQHDLNCSAYIVPNIETDATGPQWFEVIRQLSETACRWISEKGDSDHPVYLTVAVSKSDISNADRRQDLLNQLTLLRKDIGGIYLNITGIPATVDDEALLRGLLYVIFRLKWQKFEIILSKAGPWVPITFPLGLDSFGNGAQKTQQEVRSRRIPRGKGWGNSKFYNVWSPTSMSYVRYPDDAQILRAAIPLERVFGSETGLAPPFDTTPDEVYSSKAYNQATRFNHVSTAMYQMAQKYRGLSLQQRIEMVQDDIGNALSWEQKFGNVLGNSNRGKEKKVWLSVFNEFIQNPDIRDDLEELWDTP